MTVAAGGGVRRQQPVLDVDVPDQLAGQPGTALPAERGARAGGRRTASSTAPLLDQEVDPLVLQRVAYPENLASHMFALIRDRPEFAADTTELRMLDSSGRLVDAKVTWVRTIVPGPKPQCGYSRASRTSPVRMPLDGPLLPADWTAEINYLANSDGSMMMSLSEGPRDEGAGTSRAQPGLRAAVRAPATRSPCGRTPPRCRCAWRPARWGIWRRVRDAALCQSSSHD